MKQEIIQGSAKQKRIFRCTTLATIQSFPNAQVVAEGLQDDNDGNMNFQTANYDSEFGFGNRK